MWIENQKPWLLAHRAASSHAPENTLAALTLAKEQGARWVEFDVQLTKDGHTVIMHDAKLDRTTDGTGLVIDFTLNELQQLDAGSWLHAKYTGERIPTLHEWLHCAKELGMSLNLELKASGRNNSALVTAVYAILQQTEYSDLNILVSSFSLSCVRKMAKLDPTIPVAYIVDFWPFLTWRVIKKLVPSLYSIHLNHKLVNSRRVHKIHAYDLKVLVYTVDDPTMAEKLFNEGVDGIFTNDIPQLTNFLQSHA